MKFISLLFALAGLLFAPTPPAPANATWTIEGLTGSAYNIPAPLRIRQTGYSEIRFNAKFETRPFELPIYYEIRIARWIRNRAWELEFIHHKLYLKNNPQDVHAFTATHGYNLCLVTRAWGLRYAVVRLGAGIVIAHPENTIRGKKFPEKGGFFGKGYYLSGPVMAIAAAKSFHPLGRVFSTLEGKFTFSYARVPVQEGKADMLNPAIHVLLGIGGELFE